MSASTRITRLRQQQPRLLETLYAAAAEPAAWRQFMLRLVDLMDARSARLLVMDADARHVDRGVVINHDDFYYLQYIEHYVNECPWRPELSAKPDGRMYSTYLDFSCRQPDYLRTAFFNEWARPQGIHHGLLGTIYRDEQRTVQFLLQRTREPGHFTAEERQVANTLVPHLRRVCELRRFYEEGEVRGDAIVRSAELSPAPFLLLDETGQAAYVSPAAERLLTLSPAVSISRTGLRLASPAANQRLHDAVFRATRAAAGAWNDAGETLTIECPQLQRISLAVTPVRGDDAPLLFAPRRPFVAVFISPVQRKPSISKGTLQQLYGLTPAEADIAARLAVGASFRQIASARKISENTLRTQFKRIFEKTASNGQADLVRRILNSPASRNGLN